VKFCHFVASLYPHIFTSFGRFYLIFNKMALIFYEHLSFLPCCMECRRGLAIRILSVRLSVRPSIKHVICDKMEERPVQIFISYERSFSLVFWEEEWLVGVTATTWSFGSADAHWSEIANFQPIFARSASAVTPSKKVQLTLIGSPRRSFHWA